MTAKSIYQTLAVQQFDPIFKKINAGQAGIIFAAWSLVLSDDGTNTASLITRSLAKGLR
jgi:hypothetical protein